MRLDASHPARASGARRIARSAGAGDRHKPLLPRRELSRSAKSDLDRSWRWSQGFILLGIVLSARTVDAAETPGQGGASRIVACHSPTKC